MSWLEHFFINDIPSLMHDEDGCDFNPGHMIEGLISMFLSLEKILPATSLNSLI